MNASLIRTLALASLALLTCTPLLGQQTYTVQGTVTDDEGQGLLRARVTLLRATDRSLIEDSIFTDADGRYAASIVVTGVDGAETGTTPTRYWVDEIYPNPIAPGLSRVPVRYTVPGNRPETPTLELFDVAGRRVSAQNLLAAGVYFYRLRFGNDGFTAARTLVLVSNQLLRFDLVQTYRDPETTPSAGAAVRSSSKSTAQADDVVLVFEKAGYVTQEVERVLDGAATVDARMTAAAAPTPAIAVTGTREQNQPVFFDASGSAPPAGVAIGSYSWDFGNGVRAGGVKAAHLFAEPGTYTVTLTVASVYGATASTTQDVVIAAAPPPTSEGGQVRGIARGPDGQGLGGVTVHVEGETTAATSDLTGGFTLTSLPVGSPLVIHFQREGFATQRSRLTLMGTAPGYVEVTLLPRAPARMLPAAEVGGTVTGMEGVMVDLPVDGLLHDDGTPVTGAVEVNLTPVDVSDPMAVGAFPGQFEGVTPDGPADLILSYGTAEYVFSQNGNDLNLAPGKKATIEIPVYIGQNLDGTVVALGDTLPLWALNEEAGTWVQEGAGTVVASEGSPTGFALRGEVTHFSWWNIDVAPNPGYPNPIPVAPPPDDDDDDDVPDPCQDPEGWCGSNGASPLNIRLCAVGIRGMCADAGFPTPPPPDDDGDGNPDCGGLGDCEGDFDGDGDQWDDDDWDGFCDGNPFCDDFCTEIPGSCVPGNITGAPQPGNGLPVGGPRNTNVPAGGAPAGLPVPPGVPIVFTANANNGTTQGSRTTTVPAGGRTTVIIPTRRQPGTPGGPLACGTMQNATIDPMGEVDVWTFSGTAGNYVEIAVAAGTASQLRGEVRLADPSGTVFATAPFGPNQSAPGFLTLPATGTYQIAVDGTQNEPGAYTISLGCYTGIAVDQEVTDTLAAGVPDLFAFQGTAGQLLNLALLPESTGLLARAELLSPTGQLVRSTSNTSLYSETGVLALPFDGVYRIRLVGSNVSVSGAYRLGLAEIDAPTTVTLAAETPITGTLDVLGKHRFYQFTGARYDVHNLALDHPTGSLAAQTLLQRPGSQPFYQRSTIGQITTNTTTRSGEITPRLLDAPGDWIIEVKSYGVSGGTRATHTGDYRVTVLTPTPLALATDSEASGTLTAQRFAVYRFTGTAGDLVNIATLATVHGLVPASLYGPTGQLVRSTSSTSLYSETGVQALPSDGAYQIVVDGNSDARALPARARRDRPPTTVTLAAETPITGTLDVLGKHRFYQFTGALYDVHNLALDHPTGSLAAQTLLQRPGSQPFYQRSTVGQITTNTTTRSGEITPRLLDAPGDWIIEVKSYGVSGGTRATHTGDYRVTVLTPTPLALATDSEATGTLTAQRFAVYRFTGTAGDLVNIATLGEPFTGSFRASLYGPTGQLVRSTSSTSLYSETGVQALPSDGDYQIVVDGNSDGAGSYRLGLAEIDAPTTVTLAAETPITGTLDVLGKHRFYQFTGALYDVHNLALDHPTGSLAAQTLLQRPGSQPFYQRSTVGQITTNTTTRSGEITPRLLDAPGDWIIEVKSYGVSGGTRATHTGDYRVTVLTPTPLALATDSEATGTLTAQRFAVYRFTGTAGDLVNIATLGEPFTGSFRASLYGPTGQLVRSTSSTSLYSETGVQALPSDGDYQIVVDGNSDGAGSYRLGLAEIDAPTTVTPGTTVTDTLTTLGDHHFYQFTGTSGDVRAWDLSHPSGGLVAALLVRQPNASQPFYSDPVFASAFTNLTSRTQATGNRTLTLTGAHVIEVSTYGVSGGNYSNHAGPYRFTF